MFNMIRRDREAAMRSDTMEPTLNSDPPPAYEVVTLDGPQNLITSDDPPGYDELHEDSPPAYPLLQTTKIEEETNMDRSN